MLYPSELRGLFPCKSNTSAHRDLPPSSQSCVHPAITDGAYVASTHPWASKLAGPPTGSNLLRRGGRTPQATQPCTAPVRLTPGTGGQANDRRAEDHAPRCLHCKCNPLACDEIAFAVLQMMHAQATTGSCLSSMAPQVPSRLRKHQSIAKYPLSADTIKRFRKVQSVPLL